MSKVSQRRSLADIIRAEGGFVEVWVVREPEPAIVGENELSLIYGGGERVLGPEQEPEIPEWRRWLGDHAYNRIILPSDWPGSQLTRARDLFPEAEVEAYQKSTGMGQF